MKWSYVAAIVLLVIPGGCGQRELVIRHVPPTPDIAYYDGVEFHSTDGMNVFDNIIIQPAVISGTVAIVLPNGTSIDAKELTPEQLERQHVEFTVHGNDGQGNFRIQSAESGLWAVFKSRRPTWISVSPLSTAESNRRGVRNLFFVTLRDQKVPVPVKRADLESLLGEPDEIKRRRRTP